MPDRTVTARRASRLLLAAGLIVMLVLAGMMVVRARRATPAVALGQIPFSDGESWHYRMLQNGRQIGEIILTVRSGGSESLAAWLFGTETRLGIDPAAPPVENVTVTADATTLAPSATTALLELQDGRYDIRISYKPREAAYSAETPRGPQSGSQRLPGPTYDNDQLLMLIRALPLAESYSTRVTCLQSRNMAVYRAEIKVDGREDITVGGDTVPSWRVWLTAAGRTQVLWYATSPDHRLLRLNNGANGVYELEPPAGTAAGPLSAITAD